MAIQTFINPAGAFFNNVLWCRYPRCTDREAEAAY